MCNVSVGSCCSFCFCFVSLSFFGVCIVCVFFVIALFCFFGGGLCLFVLFIVVVEVAFFVCFLFFVCWVCLLLLFRGIVGFSSSSFCWWDVVCVSVFVVYLLSLTGTEFRLTAH